MLPLDLIQIRADSIATQQGLLSPLPPFPQRLEGKGDDC